MSKANYEVIQPSGGGIIKAWVRGVPFEDTARRQLENTARLPFIHKWVAAMPDVHMGLGATIGSVIPTTGAIIPAAVGVDLGCGMMACRTSLTAEQLPDSLKAVRSAIEKAVPHGRTDKGGANDRGSWSHAPKSAQNAWSSLARDHEEIIAKYPKISRAKTLEHLGTLGTGNHFIEMCLDQEGRVWLMLHSGSRGIGNRIGTHFIEMAKQDMRTWHINLPDKDLAYLAEGTRHFEDYTKAVGWAQKFARLNREVMMTNITDALSQVSELPDFETDLEAVNCHHNYISHEHHFGKDVWVTRKGAVRARKDDLGIIPGSMGARSYIVRGLGNPDSFHSCSHGAGRTMSRTEARRRFTVADHAAATKAVECRKDEAVLDETPAAYKSIDAVMAAQKDLVEVVHTLRQVVCVKG